MPTAARRRLQKKMQTVPLFQGRQATFSLLYSSRGSVRQCYHTDYAPETLATVRATAVEKKISKQTYAPISVLFALQDNTKLGVEGMFFPLACIIW